MVTVWGGLGTDHSAVLLPCSLTFKSIVTQVPSHGCTLYLFTYRYDLALVHSRNQAYVVKHSIDASLEVKELLLS